MLSKPQPRLASIRVNTLDSFPFVLHTELFTEFLILTSASDIVVRVSGCSNGKNGLRQVEERK